MQTTTDHELVLILDLDEAKQLHKTLDQIDGLPDDLCYLRKELLRALAGRRIPHDE